MNLGGALCDVDRVEEAMVIDKELVALMRRLYGPDDTRTIEAEERLAIAQMRLVEVKCDKDNLRLVLQTLMRTHAWKLRKFGRDDDVTLESAGYLANALRKVGEFSKGERLLRDVIARRRRINGATHFHTLENQWQLAILLTRQKKNDEASQLRDRVLPVVRRVLGPDHRITQDLARPDFLDCPR